MISHYIYSKFYIKIKFIIKIGVELRKILVTSSSSGIGQTTGGSLFFPEGIDTALFSKHEVLLPEGLGSPHTVVPAITELQIDDGAHMKY